MSTLCRHLESLGLFRRNMEWMEYVLTVPLMDLRCLLIQWMQCASVKYSTRCRAPGHFFFFCINQLYLLLFYIMRKTKWHEGQVHHTTRTNKYRHKFWFLFSITLYRYMQCVSYVSNKQRWLLVFRSDSIHVSLYCASVEYWLGHLKTLVLRLS